MSRATSSTWRRRRAGASRRMAVEAGDDVPGGPAPVRARIVDAGRAEERGRGAAAAGRSAARQSQGGDAAAGADRRAARPGGAGEGASPILEERISSASRRCSSAASLPRRSSTTPRRRFDRDKAGLEEAQRADPRGPARRPLRRDRRRRSGAARRRSGGGAGGDAARPAPRLRAGERARCRTCSSGPARS